MIERMWFRKAAGNVFQVSLIVLLAGGIMAALNVFAFDLAAGLNLTQKGLIVALSSFISFGISMSFGLYLTLSLRLRLHRRLPVLIRLPLEWLLLAFLTFVWDAAAYYSAFTAGLVDDRGFLETLGASAGMSALIYAGLLVGMSLHGLVGWKNFFASLTGHYYRPQKSTKVIAFVDMKNSTAVSEKLGAEKFFQVIDRFLELVEFTASYFGGEIHKYVGDCAIITWDDDEAGRGRALDFARQLSVEFAQRKDEIQQDFGVEFSFSAGFHAGEIMRVDIGDMRREIGIWGNAVNLTQRIQGQCKILNEQVLLSQEVAGDPSTQALRPHTGVFLPGKETPVTLFAL